MRCRFCVFKHGLRNVVGVREEPNLADVDLLLALPR